MGLASRTEKGSALYSAQASEVREPVHSSRSHAGGAFHVGGKRVAGVGLGAFRRVSILLRRSINLCAS